MAPRKRKPRGATTKGGWSYQHQRRRASRAPFVNAGHAVCARCHYPIERGEEWHLDQNDTRDGYLGVSHARCNLSAAGDKTFALHGHNGYRHPTRFHAKQAPLEWSRRWCDDPPVGTIVFGHERVIYLGNDKWQPLDDTPND